MAEKPPPDSKLLVISFENPLRAQEYLLAVSGLQSRDDIQLHVFGKWFVASMYFQYSLAAFDVWTIYRDLTVETAWTQ